MTDSAVFIPVSSRFQKIPSVPDEDRPKGCDNCAFGGIKVGSRGPIDSPFVVVGESPGANELLKGYPFVGMSGDMLEDTLMAVGWDPKTDPEPYFTNAIQCFPQKKDPDTMAGAVRCCQSRLYNELTAYPRKIVLALGAAATWSLTNDFGLRITRDRGHLFEHPCASIGAIITLHPAYLMRQGSVFPKWKKDLDYAVSLLHGIDPKDGLWSPPTWTTITTREEYEQYVLEMEDPLTTHIAGDIETGGPRGAGLDFQRGYILELVTTSNRSDGKFVHILPGELLWEHEDLTKRLLGCKAKWIWQNGKFDVKFFRFEGVTEARVDEDSMLLSYAMNENKGHDLDEIAWEWIGAQKHKDTVDKWFEQHGIKKADRDYALLPTDLRRKYAALDVSKTYRMFWPLKDAVVKDKHLNKLYHRILIPGSEFLTNVEMKGLCQDPARVVANDEYLYNQLCVDQFNEDGVSYKYKSPETIIQEYAKAYLGQQINIGSWQQLQRLLWDRMKLGTPGSATNEDVIIHWQRKNDHPIFRALLKWRKISKARNTYVKNALSWPGVDGRVHVSFKLHATTTGRLSSSQPTNLQNWPRDPVIRGEFVAAPGKILVECDLNQAELRCLAIMSADPTLLDIYTRNEVSIHHITSVAMFGEQYTDDEKMRAKAVNFGIVYGRSAPSIAEEFDISIKEADEYIRIWFARYPVARDFINESRNAPNQLRTMITNFGRKKRWGVVSAEMLNNLQNEAANFPHQSTAHDITLVAGIECQPVIKRLWDADFVNEIHDALYFEIENNPDIYGPAIAYVQSVMQRVPTEWGLTRVPFLAEAKVGTRWGGRKNAKDAGITDPAELSQYMGDFKPTAEHAEQAIQMLRDSLRAQKLVEVNRYHFAT